MAVSCSASSSIFHGGVSSPDVIGTEAAPLPFPVSKAQLKGRAAHTAAYPLDNKEAKLMGEQVCACGCLCACACVCVHTSMLVNVCAYACLFASVCEFVRVCEFAPLCYVDDVRVSFLQSRVDQLRKIHDRMVVEIEKKDKALKDLQRKIADREMVDRKVTQELQATEVSPHTDTHKRCICLLTLFFNEFYFIRFVCVLRRHRGSVEPMLRVPDHVCLNACLFVHLMYFFWGFHLACV